MAQTLIIIPTYNEVENIALVLEEIFTALPSAHVLFVDDSSPDGTAKEINSAQNSYPGQVFLEIRKEKQGLGKAYVHGFQWALAREYDYIFEMDADLSHPASSLPQMITTLEQANDIVVGSRYLSGVNVVNWPIMRILLSLTASIYVRLITGLPVKDATAGFVGYRASALAQLDLTSLSFVGYAFQIEMKFKLWKKGCSIKEIPIVFVNREKGVSKMNSSIIWEAIYGVIYLKFESIYKSK
ncbi:MAG: polyprenol monophosphomannose synthase [Flavobacteriaceae bacterium]